MTTQAQIDELKATVAILTAQVNDLTPDAGTPPIAATIANFKATPSTISVGEVVVLTANVANAVTLTLDGAPVTLPITLMPAASHTYTLQATGADGTLPAVALAGVVVNAVVIPPTGELVPLLGGALHSSQFCWLADYADASKLTPRAVPWTVPIPTKSMNGVRPARVRVMHLWQQIQGLYSMFPGVNGPYEPNVGSDIAAIADDLRRRPPPVGPRGICYLSPYGTPHDHPFFMADGVTPIPRAPLWMYLLHHGVVQMLMPDGSIHGTAQIPGIKYCSAWVVYEIDRRFFFVCNHGTPTYTTPSTWSGASVDLVFRGAGMGSAAGPEDATKYIVTTFKSSPLPLGVCCDENGNIYIADHITGKITKTATAIGTDAAGKPTIAAGAETLVATIPGIVAMAYHEGTLRCMDNRTGAYVVDIATGTIGPNLQTVLSPTGPVAYGSRFWSVSVDRTGTFGPKGNWSFTRDVGEANLDAYDFEASATTPGGYKLTPGWKGGQGLQRVGDHTTVQETKGHYPWIYFYHRWLPVAMSAGVSGSPQLLVAYDAIDAAKIPAELPLGQFNYEIGTRFQQLWRKGGVKASPFNVPSLTCFTTKEGASPFKDCSFDEMAERPFDDTEGFLLGGMIGQFPRTFDVGPNRYALMYGVYSNSQRFLRESQGLIDKMDAWWIAKYGPVPGRTEFFDNPSDPVLGHPILPKDPLDRWAVVKPDGVGIEMWNIDNMQPSWLVPAGASIIYDQGLPTQSAVKPNRPAAATVTNLPPGYLTRAVVVP